MSPKRLVELCDCLTPEGISVQSPITTKSKVDGRWKKSSFLAPKNWTQFALKKEHMFVRHLYWLSEPSNIASSGHEHRFIFFEG